MGYILIDDIQVPAEKYSSEEEAKKRAANNEYVVKDDDGDYWVVRKDDYEKIKPYGYSVIE